MRTGKNLILKPFEGNRNVLTIYVAVIKVKLFTNLINDILKPPYQDQRTIIQI